MSTDGKGNSPVQPGASQAISRFYYIVQLKIL